MIPTLDSRVVEVDGKLYTVHRLPGILYTTVIQGPETLALDTLFGLNGAPLRDGDQRIGNLVRAAAPCELGEAHVENVLRYFVNLAVRGGNFVGLYQKEVYAALSAGKVRSFGQGDVELALRHKDTHGPYLGEVSLENKVALVPQNLQINVF